MIRTLSAVSVAALLVAAPTAFAQSPQPSDAAGGDKMNTQMKTDDNSTQLPAGQSTDTINRAQEPSSDEAKDRAADQAQDRSTDPAMDRSRDQAQTPSTDDKAAEREVAGQIVLQEDNTFLASDLMNTNVYASNSEDANAVGDVNDIIFAKSGEVHGVVIGVGGFLGIGEKDVAIKMDRLSMVETDSGIKLVLETTKEELEKAPAFKSKKDQQTAARADKAKRDAEMRVKAPGMNTTPPARTEDTDRSSAPRSDEPQEQKKTY